VDLYLLDLKFFKNPLTDNNTIKVNIFITKFFPKTGIVDFSNIETTMEQRVFNISSIILVEKINKLIKSLLNKKALGLNSILNKVFKVVALVIIKDLIEIISYYFASRTIIKSRKYIAIIKFKNL